MDGACLSRPLLALYRSCLAWLPFHAHRNAHATAYAKSGEALFGVSLLHLIEQRHQHPPPRCADRVPNRNRSAIDVDLRSVPAKVLVDRTGLRGEGFVCFDEIEIADAPAGLFEGRARSRNGSGAHDRGVDPGMRPGHDA